MESGESRFSARNIARDLTAAVVVFLVALPLCLGIALASDAPLFAGLVAGIIGGIVVGSISGSHTSVSGPAAGLTAIVVAQIATLGFPAFLLAVMLAGVIQIGLGLARAGSLSAFFPSSVINGLLAAIGVILILKQIPHLFGRDTDPEGEMSFEQPDDYNTFSEIWALISDNIHIGAAVVGIVAVILLLVWDRIPALKKSNVPGPLVAVLMGIALHQLFQQVGGTWAIGTTHLVQIPIADSFDDFVNFLTFPDFTEWANPAVYIGAVTIAIVASLETLLNLDAVDKLDRERRHSPPSRELVAQGVGNVISGGIGGLPMTSVIVRSSVNVSIGAKTKLSAIMHGVLLLVCVGFLPVYLNMIPLSALAGVLIVTGFKLANPKLFKRMWSEGRYQFIPFIITLVAIVFSDLLIGILIGLATSATFILNSNLRRPIRRIVETHLDGDLVHIELSPQVSFLNRAALSRLFISFNPRTNVLIDASHTHYIDPDVLSLIRDFKESIAPAHDVTVRLRGFKDRYDQLEDDVAYADYSTRELLDRVSPQQVMDILKEGNRRFREGHTLSRDYSGQIIATAKQQNPLAVVLGCIDSRVPIELIFDLGIGDALITRVGGNVIGPQPLASVEYAVDIARVKVVLVLGHTRCGAVTSVVQHLSGESKTVTPKDGHLHFLVDEIAPSYHQCAANAENLGDELKLINAVSRCNAARSVEQLLSRSESIATAAAEDRILVAGAVYDVSTGGIDFLESEKPG